MMAGTFLDVQTANDQAAVGIAMAVAVAGLAVGKLIADQKAQYAVGLE
jgi:hypothetical protein